MASARIAQQAVSRGEEVHLIVWSNEAAPGARATERRADLFEHRIGRLPLEADSVHSLTEHTSDIVREHDIDLVHGIYAVHAGYAATLAAAWHDKPSVVSLRGNDLHRALYHAEELPFVSHAIRSATRVTGVTRELCSRASRVFGRSVDYVPNSVDSNTFRPEASEASRRAALGIDGAPVLGFLGELREKKGLRFLLPAFAELLRRRPAWLLLIGGVRRDSAPALAAFGEGAPEAMARIRQVDYVRDPKRLRALLALCDGLVFPALHEGMPNSVLEAMACARPVLATATGGHLDLIEHGRTGALLPLSSLDRLPDALEEFLALGSAERDSMGQNARRFVIDHHDPSLESAAYALLYDAACAEISARSRA